MDHKQSPVTAIYRHAVFVINKDHTGGPVKMPSRSESALVTSVITETKV
jgi:hypothetical protein